jgi:hypothetical protein
MILDRAIVAASFVTEGASNPAFAQPGCPCDEQVLIAVDPVTADQPGEDGSPCPSFSVLAFSSAMTCASVSTKPSWALLASSARFAGS